MYHMKKINLKIMIWNQNTFENLFSSRKYSGLPIIMENTTEKNKEINMKNICYQRDNSQLNRTDTEIRFKFTHP